MKPRGSLIEQDTFIKKHTHFDSVPYANIRMVDVARILDTESGKDKLNVSVVAKLLDRVITGLEHTIIALQGRPEGVRIIGLLHRSFNRLLGKIPEFKNESFDYEKQIRGALSRLPLEEDYVSGYNWANVF